MAALIPHPMSSWSQLDASSRPTFLRAFGEPVTYTPLGGEPITLAADGVSPLRAILQKPTIDQSTSPGYFADVDMDPGDIPTPRRRDEVTWSDGTVYLVNKIVNQPYGFTTLALHRKLDP